LYQSLSVMSEPSELLVATNNAGKVRELSQLLAGLTLRLHLLSEFEDIAEAEETGATFAENATLKALHYSARAGLLTLSDDSGLVFVPEAHAQTFGELPDEIKQTISHRARALAKAAQHLREYFQ